MTYTPQEVFTKLGELEPDEIAKLFKSLAIRGRRGDGSNCPVSQYVRTETGARTLHVARWWWDIRAASEDKRQLPQSVSAFVTGFDSGDYPELEIE